MGLLPCRAKYKEQGSNSEVDGRSAIQETCRLLEEMKVHSLVYKARHWTLFWSG
jgi:hypothetical protein